MQTVECAEIYTCSELVTKTHYRWSDEYKMLYKDTINGAEIQTNFLEIIDEAKAIVEPSNVDTTVSKINNLILSAAEPCKVTSRQTSRNVTRRKNVSPWYDGECEKQRKIYNTLRNQYA